MLHVRIISPRWLRGRARRSLSNCRCPLECVLKCALSDCGQFLAGDNPELRLAYPVYDFVIYCTGRMRFSPRMPGLLGFPTKPTRSTQRWLYEIFSTRGGALRPHGSYATRSPISPLCVDLAQPPRRQRSFEIVVAEMPQAQRIWQKKRENKA